MLLFYLNPNLWRQSTYSTLDSWWKTPPVTLLSGVLPQAKIQPIRSSINFLLYLIHSRLEAGNFPQNFSGTFSYISNAGAWLQLWFQGCCSFLPKLPALGDLMGHWLLGHSERYWLVKHCCNFLGLQITSVFFFFSTIIKNPKILRLYTVKHCITVVLSLFGYSKCKQALGDKSISLRA